MQRKLKKAKRHLIGVIRGTSEKPRLSVFRSSKYLYGQIIDDSKRTTLVAVDGRALLKNELKDKSELSDIEQAKALGKVLAEKAKKHKIASIVFDRNGYKYHGRVRAFAEGAREGGLQF